MNNEDRKWLGSSRNCRKIRADLKRKPKEKSVAKWSWEMDLAACTTFWRGKSSAWTWPRRGTWAGNEDLQSGKMKTGPGILPCEHESALSCAWAEIDENGIDPVWTGKKAWKLSSGKQRPIKSGRGEFWRDQIGLGNWCAQEKKINQAQNSILQEQCSPNTRQNGDETHKQKPEICSIKTEHDSHTITEVAARHRSFNYWNKNLFMTQ
jgi:hypothetical protein